MTMSAVDPWDPTQYNRFAAEREQPFWDLARLLQPVESATVVDLGCGDGRLTASLSDELNASSTLGIDSSAVMISAAASHRTHRIRFELGDLGTWSRPASWDIVFANASLQWVPDHPAVLARWTSSLRPDGQLAVQVPDNADHPAYLTAADLGREWFDHPPPDPVAQNVLAPERYAELLDDLGFGQQHVRLEVYPHHLESTAAVVEWVKGTSLNRFKELLDPADWDRFVDAYRQRLLAVLGDRSPYLYLFKRILVWGRRP
jgi:trans-aconitate 2-methyltransferase